MKLINFTFFAFLALNLLESRALADASCDFDGDGKSEIAIVNLGADGRYNWSAFHPATGNSTQIIQSFGTPNSKLIPGNWLESDEAIAAIVDPVDTNAGNRATWTVKYLDNGKLETYSKNLGRSGDIIINGGDYDGNGVTDSLILKQTTGKLGLRVNYFLSNYNGNNLGTERLYKALGTPFRDRNFFFSPDGNSDYLAVLRSGKRTSSILKLKPFTDTPSVIKIGSLPANIQGPIALKEGSGHPDLLVFYEVIKGQTHFIIKNNSGKTVIDKTTHAVGQVLVGDYLPDTGYELAIKTTNDFYLLNPITNKELFVAAPSGQVVSCVGNISID